MQRIKHLIALRIAANVRRHDRISVNNFDSIDVRFHSDCLERALPRHAVTGIVESSKLILVDLRFLTHTCVERMLRKSCRCGLLSLEANTNCFRLTTADAIAFINAALPKISVEFLKIFHLRHRSRPVALQRLHANFDNRLFVAAARHAVQRIKREVTGQRCVAFVDGAFATLQNRSRHGLRIVPPDFLRHTSEKFKSLTHTFENRFGPLSRQSNRKRSVRIRPHQNQHADLPATIRKVDSYLTEVRFDSPARSVIERNEGLPFRCAMLLHEATNSVISTRIIMFVPQPHKDPRRRVTLLRRGTFILLQNLPNQVMKRPQLRSGLPLPFRIFAGLGLIAVEDLPNLVSRMMKPSSHLANAHPITMSSPNASVIVHREHFRSRNH